jgi:uncharacterized DUF497 family protein
MTFEWDETKNEENIAKHSVSFEEAQEAFLDPDLIMIEDILHSQKEKRFFCIGKTGNGIATVRFTIRNQSIRIIGAGYWRKENKYMKRKIIYTDAPPEIDEAIEKGRIIPNFLPPAEQLIFKRNSEQVIIPLKNGSFDFFRRYARKQKTSFQDAISNVLEDFATQHAAI